MEKTPTVNRVPYSLARYLIQSGDLLSFKPRCYWYRPWSWITWLIALTNPGHVCHTAMAAWWGNNLLIVQMTSSPQRIVLMSEVVKRWPGKITVSRPIRGDDACDTYRLISNAVENMVRITELPYGWLRLLALGFAHTFTGGLLYPNVPDDQYQNTKWPPVCSESYSRAMRLAGWKPCPGRPDCRTEPHDLYESDRFVKLFTLI